VITVLVWTIILCVPTFIYIASPIFRQGKIHSPRPESRITSPNTSEALAQAIDREQYYSALSDLEEDYEVGKISPEDYQRLRRLLLQETADLLRDTKTDQADTASDPTPVSVESLSVKAEIEIEKYRRSQRSSDQSRA